jgi:hypothetical protein
MPLYIAAAVVIVTNAIVRTSAFAIAFLAAFVLFGVLTGIAGALVSLPVSAIADLFWNVGPGDDETIQGLIAFAIAALFAAGWVLLIRQRLHADFPSVAAYIVIGAATSAIYVMVAFQLVIYVSEFLPGQFNDNMGSGGSLVDQLIFFIDNLLHVILLDMMSIFQWRISDIAPTTTLGRWLVFLTRLVMTISFAAYISTLIKTAHLRLDEPVPVTLR